MDFITKHNKNRKKDARNISSMRVNPERKQMLIKYLLVNYFKNFRQLAVKMRAPKCFNSCREKLHYNNSAHAMQCYPFLNQL